MPGDLRVTLYQLSQFIHWRKCVCSRLCGLTRRASPLSRTFASSTWRFLDTWDHAVQLISHSTSTWSNYIRNLHEWSWHIMTVILQNSKQCKPVKHLGMLIYVANLLIAPKISKGKHTGNMEKLQGWRFAGARQNAKSMPSWCSWFVRMVLLGSFAHGITEIRYDLCTCMLVYARII